ncbi:MAG: hypothetical protein M1480_13085 [Bacteroidetes bacterium]|nr:hypothetical protein [Bacteroidota bacterium]
MKKIIFIFSVIIVFSNISCSVYKTIVNVSRLKFKLGTVNNLSINGVSLEGKTNIKDFSPFEILRITSAFANKSFPVSFLVNVEAKNPNDGTSGYPRTDIELKSFPWNLYIDDKETIGGNINNSVSIPGTGEITIIPIRVDIDLLRFFKDKDYDQLINLAFAISGDKSHASKIALYAQPTVSTSIGDVTYPGKLKIISKEFSN